MTRFALARLAKTPLKLATAGILSVCVLQGSHAIAGDSPAFPPTVKVGGSAVQRIGWGLREFLFIDIYELGAYSKSGSCDPRAIVSREETRYMKLRMMRDIPKARLVSNLRKSLLKNLPANASAELQGKVETFLGYLKSDLKEGAIVEIVYRPGAGTTLKAGGAALGPTVPGKDFADVVWRAYFGPKTCCSSLKDDILEVCRGEG